MTEREQLREELALHALAKHLAHQPSAGPAEDALQTALRLLAFDPLQEPVHAIAPRDGYAIPYSENVTVNKANLTLQGQGNPRLQPGNAAAAGIEVVADGVTIRGLDVAGFSAAIFNCGVRVDANGADIRDNRVTTNSIASVSGAGRVIVSATTSSKTTPSAASTSGTSVARLTCRTTP